MKICFNNFFPPVNKLIAIVVCMLLLLSYTKLKAADRSGCLVEKKNLNIKINTLIQLDKNSAHWHSNEHA